MISFLGRYQLGDFVPVAVVCRNSSKVPVAPTSAPLLTTYVAGSSTPVLEDQKIAPQGVGVTGLFAFDLFLGSTYAAGKYCALVEWASGGTSFAALSFFEILAGGDSKGAYTSLEYYDRPHADFLIGGTESGEIVINRGPYL